MPCQLFRAVTKNEYDDISSKGNRFRPQPGGIECKQFAVSEDCGHYYGREVVRKLDHVDDILLRVVLSKDVFCLGVIVLDNCKAVAIDRTQIDDFNECIVEIAVVN